MPYSSLKCYTQFQFFFGSCMPDIVHTHYIYTAVHDIRVHVHVASLDDFFPQVTCCECVRSGQMIVSGGSAGVISFWSITNTLTVC